MEYYVAILFSFYLLACVNGHINDYTEEDYCPSFAENGDWETDYDEKGLPYRCILRCDSGFEPSDCHVIRRKGPRRWNRDIPTCVKPPIVSGKTLAAVGVGAAAVVGAPFALAAAGFGAGGVVAGSLAAWLQGSATAAGSVFALGQSAGAAGLAATTQAGIFRSITTATWSAAGLLSECEDE